MGLGFPEDDAAFLCNTDDGRVPTVLPVAAGKQSCLLT